MSNLSEEEIIEILQRVVLVNNFESFSSEGIIIEAIQGLLDLYNKEKEKNKELIEGQIKTLEKILQPQLFKKYVSKDKIKEKIDQVNKEYLEELSKAKDLFEQTILEHQRYTMENVLQELLEEGGKQ